MHQQRSDARMEKMIQKEIRQCLKEVRRKDGEVDAFISNKHNGANGSDDESSRMKWCYNKLVFNYDE